MLPCRTGDDVESQDNFTAFCVSQALKSYNQHETYIRPHLQTAKRGYRCKIALYRVFNYILKHLHMSCQWAELPIAREQDGTPEISWQAVYYHFRKWSADGSLQQVWHHSLRVLKAELDLRQLNLDGSHALAKKGGESIAYQARKRGKTSNILLLTDANGLIIGCTGVLSGHHHDAFELKAHLQSAFKTLKQLGVKLEGAFFNADSAFDTREARRVCFNYHVIPNIVENTRNRKKPKRGRKRLFNPHIYPQRFTSERTFAWIDKFRALLIRFDRKQAHFLAAHHLAFAMNNLRHLFAAKV
jgi:transposase